MPQNEPPFDGGSPMMNGAYTLAPGKRFHLRDFDSGDTGGHRKKSDAESKLLQGLEELATLQEMLHAGREQALLIVLQGIDAGGKDGTIKHVMGAFNPQGVDVTAFKAPTEEELSHDFLWRVHRAVPPLGVVGIFNRSHYEDVLVARVKNLVAKSVWKRRYEHINDFERLLVESKVTVVKFFLHISRDEQAVRLRERLADPHKNWKIAASDLEDRKLWDRYHEAFDEMLTRCNTSYAPWYVVPADKKWYRNLVVSRVLVERMKAMKLRFPDPPPDLDTYKISK
jgi:PPK2 family polyphosphate:nucleotide phosphotransferase